MNVAVLMGGISSERDVSLRSGAAVSEGLRAAGHTVWPVDVTRVDFELPAAAEVVFVALHGTFGEDGGVQRELRRRGIPFTGAGEDASRRAFDKRISKRLFARHGIPTPAWELVCSGGRPSSRWPLVVKPPCEGSTMGIHRVTRESEWEPAFQDALRYDTEVIVEEYIAGRELTVGIVDDETLAVVEIVAPDGWYDYGAKYESCETVYHIPAAMPLFEARECRRLAALVYRTLGCRGMGRVDFRMDTAGRFHVLELNTIPGFTATSLLPKAALYAGMKFPALCDRILRTAAA